MDTNNRLGQGGLRDALILAVMMVAIVIAAIFLLGDSYLLFHTFIELFTAAIGLMIFSIAWHTRNITSSAYVAFLGMAAFPVAMITILHTLSYKGMSIFPAQGANLPTTLWIILKGMQASAFLIAPIYLVRPLKSAGTVLAIYSVASVALVGLTFGGLMPAAYVEGVGLTAFKVWVEYAIIAASIAGGVLLFTFREHLERKVLGLLFAYVGAAVLAEILFTLYNDVTGFKNRLGHIAHLAAFLFLYMALVSTSLEEPLSSLFRQLKKQREELAAAYETEHDIAETLQSAMEVDIREVPGVEISHRYMPAPGRGHIGGDFYDVFRLADGLVGFAMGDVCGKGLNAATNTVRARSAIRALAFQQTDPAALLESANTYLHSELEDDSFVTALFGTIDTEKGDVKIAIAGHPDPLVCGRTGEHPPVGVRSQPMGVLPELGVGTWSFRLSPGETLLMVTDGVIEAPGPEGRFGTEKLEVVVGEPDADHNPDSVVSLVIDTLLEHTRESLDDDVAVMAIRFLPQGS